METQSFGRPLAAVGPAAPAAAASAPPAWRFCKRQRTALPRSSSQQIDSGTAAAPSADMPLLAAVMERGQRVHEAPFHVPGHKRGNSTPPALQALLGSAMRYDLTELEGLDNLSSPCGPIAHAQHLAAQLWGADATWFLVNGTTVGIHAAVLATCATPGTALLLPRNAHLSAFNAVVLAGCTPVYMQPAYDTRLGLAHQLTPAAVEAGFAEAAERGLRVGAALVVSPTYFGVLSDIAGLAAVCHSHGVPLLVDEAHGAHLGLHPALPRSALQQGADVVVQSTHKQLSAATQAAMLHAQGGLVDQARLAHALQMLQTSSPSYLLMASLDAARAQAANPSALEECLAAAQYARSHLAGVPGLQLLAPEDVVAAGVGPDLSGGKGACSCGLGLDPLRLTVGVAGLGLSGFEAAAQLEQQFSVVPELATPSSVVMALSMGSTLKHAHSLVGALRQMSQQCASHGGSSRTAALMPLAGATMVLTPRKAFFAPAETVPAALAVGRVAAELLCPYPPGVPALYPGELIEQAALASLHAVLESGGYVTGCADASLKTLRVVVIV